MPNVESNTKCNIKESAWRIYIFLWSPMKFLLYLHDYSIREVVKVCFFRDILSDEFVGILNSTCSRYGKSNLATVCAVGLALRPCFSFSINSKLVERSVRVTMAWPYESTMVSISQFSNLVPSASLGRSCMLVRFAWRYGCLPCGVLPRFARETSLRQCPFVQCSTTESPTCGDYPLVRACAHPILTWALHHTYSLLELLLRFTSRDTVDGDTPNSEAIFHLLHQGKSHTFAFRLVVCT